MTEEVQKLHATSAQHATSREKRHRALMLLQLGRQRPDDLRVQRALDELLEEELAAAAESQV